MNYVRLLILFLFIFSFPGLSQQPQLIEYDSNLIEQSAALNQKLIIDSDLNLDEAISGQTIPANVKENIVLETVYYYGFDGELHQGQLLVNKKVAKDIREIFEIIRETRFPIEKVIPICEYKWSDSESMMDNNTCSFNYRFVSGSRILSMHASGTAIDINPKLNPYIKNGNTMPAGAVYDTTAAGTFTSNSDIVKEFKKRGWTWGGDWKSIKDYQHFQKEIE